MKKRMKAQQILTTMLLAAMCAMACNNAGRRDADDSVEQAQDVNDTTAMVNEKDGDFAVKAADAGLTEVELGKLAQEKASDQRVKDFAQMMINDHQKANDELMAIATRHHITLPPVISKDQADKQRKLREKSGADFDKEYIDLMVKDHNKVMSLFEDAASDLQNTELKGFASKTLPVLRKHHEQASAIRDSISPTDTTTIQRVLP